MTAALGHSDIEEVLKEISMRVKTMVKGNYNTMFQTIGTYIFFYR